VAPNQRPDGDRPLVRNRVAFEATEA